MAKKVWDTPITKEVDWGGDASTDNLPVSGAMVQRFIKESLEGKAGIFYYDATNNRYLVFSDADARDEYIIDPTKTELVIGTFDAPFNYTAEITLSTPAYNAVQFGSVGNYIDFTFDIKNKQGTSTGENVMVTYTFIRNATKRVVKETRRYGESVHFNVDKYIDEGTNTIIVGVTGQTSLAATTVAITYQVVNLAISDNLDISKAYNLKDSSQVVEIPFTVSGYGTKIVEWYLDGELLDFVKAEDEVVDVSATRTKYITLANLAQGRHSIQIRAYTVINGENFYTDTLYRDILVYTGANNEVIIGVAVTIPRLYGIMGANDPIVIYNMVQYVPYNLRFATYSPTNASNTEVTIKLDGALKGSVSSVNNVENVFSIVPTTSGTKMLELVAGNVTYTITTEVEKTSMNLEEITNGLVLDFNAIGKTNNSEDRDVWSYGDYEGTFSGFNWNNTSGWVNNRLEMSAGSSFGINIAPLLGNPTSTGKTIEIEWSTKNVTNDDAIICDLRNENGIGIVITATKVSMTSADGVVVETEYKSDENVRVGFVINQSSGTTNQRLSFIYANGIVSRGEKWAVNDSYTSDAEILFTATVEAEISLKSIRIYDNALTSDQMLNNYILYRDTIAEMMEIYDRNDVYIDGTAIFSPDKMMSRLPVMIVTGDIPTLENTSDKDTQIVVDIEYYNMQDTDKSFRMTGAAMRPQGTSSMGYPKKNFRIYTQKVDGTVLYDANGNVVEDKLYAFKDGAQPVDCWCLKADYAESSGTHNTGIARLWNDALINAQVDGEYVCRTEAQKAAMAVGYEYDVRTTIDGFPILLFYRPRTGADIIFIGKYNFNNDKSTESVFGFENIPDFNNSKMQCWEVLNNGNPLALFTTVSGFDSGWSEAFESRYPDTKSPNTSYLKAFCQWMVNVTQEDFATQKWEHLNVYMMAAYWCYLMRHAGADQFVKNAMFTSEDGQHFYYILYDNDTINGLINTGRLRIKPTDDRQTVDENGEYVFAGHDSRLWNMLEADEEFKNIVSTVDNALYSAGISYANTIAMFDDEQADKWVEKVYNQDAQYKYVGPYVEKGIDNLFMLQGKRDLHRRWWLAKRFAIYDAKYVSGTYKSQAVELKCLNDTVAGQQFSITAGYPLDYGYGINNIPRSFGITLGIGESHTFTTEEKVNLGDPIRIYGAPHLAEIDLSPMSDRLAVLTITNVYDEVLRTKLTRLVVGNANKTNYELTEISGLRQAVALEYLDIQGMTKINSVDLSYHPYIKALKAFGSGISSVTFAKGAPITTLELPSTMRVLSLQQLPYLTVDGIAFESIANLSSMTITNCPNLSNDFDFVYNWLTNKTISDAQTSLVMDGVDWSGVSSEELERVALIASNGGTLSLKGKVVLTDINEERGELFTNVFGDSVYDENAEFYIDAPLTVNIDGPTTILSGESAQYIANVYPKREGTFTYSLSTTASNYSIDVNTGVLTTIEKDENTYNIQVRVDFVSNEGETASSVFDVILQPRVYPENATIQGENNPLNGNTYTWGTTTDNLTGIYSAKWELSGDITSYFAIATQDNNECALNMTYMPLGEVTGTLKLTLTKGYNNSAYLTATKTLTAVNSDVIITGRSNAPIQATLYAAGLVANETYTLKSEASNITETQLQNGNTSIFYARRNEITSFNEFKHFTSVTAINTSCFRELVKLTSIELPTSIATIGATAFQGCVALTTISIPANVTSINNSAFLDTGMLEILVSTSNANFASLDGVLFNKNFTQLIKYAKDKVQAVYEISEGVANIADNAFATCNALTSVTIPSTMKSIGATAFSGCLLLGTIKCNAATAPTVISTTFGSNTTTWVGRSNYSKGTNRLYIPMNAVGYETSYWLDPLQNASKSGYSIHGKVTITSNRPEAQFKVDYTTLSGTAKSVTVTAGTFYLNDIQYGKTITITPLAMTGYTWDVASSSSTYNGAYSTEFNAYVYPTGVSISGSSTIKGGESATYNAILTPSNVDVDVTYTWSVSGSTNVTIAPSSGNGCVLNTVTPDADETFTITCIAKTTDNKVTVQATINVVLQERPNFITATYNVTTAGTTQLFYKLFQVAKITYMEVNGVQVTPSLTYSLSVGTHKVRFSTTSLDDLFSGITTALINVDFSECDGSKYNSLYSTFYNCNALTSIRWGDCNFPQVTSLFSTFSGCKNLASINLSPFKGASITSIQSTFYNCNALTSIRWGDCKFPKVTNLRQTFNNCYRLTYINLSPFKGASITNLEYTFSGCSLLTSIDLSPLDCASITSIQSIFNTCNALTSIRWGDCKFPKVTSLVSTFSGCSALTSIDLSPFEGAPITSLQNAFAGCSRLTSINLSPLEGAPVSSLYRTFYNCDKLTSINLSPLEGASITSLYYTFSGCRALRTIDLSPLEITSYVTSLSDTFYNCNALTSIEWGNCKFPKVTSLSNTFNQCNVLTSIDLSPFEGAPVTNWYYAFNGCKQLSRIIVPWTEAPVVSSNTFGSSSSSWTGYSTSGNNTLFVPSGATGYNSGYWLDPLQNSSKCGFTLSATL